MTKARSNKGCAAKRRCKATNNTHYGEKKRRVHSSQPKCADAAPTAVENNGEPEKARSDAAKAAVAVNLKRNLGTNEASEVRSIINSRTRRGMSPTKAYYRQPQDNFDRKESKNYVEWTMEGRDTNKHTKGIAKIVFLSQDNEVIEEEMDSEEIIFQLKLARLCTGHSRRENGELADCLKHLSDYVNDLKQERDVYKHLVQTTQTSDPSFVRSRESLQKNCTTKTWQTKIPRTEADTRVFYSEGKNCIRSTIPYPKVQTLGDRHAYVSIQECIAHLLLHGGYYEDVNNPTEEMRGSIHFCSMAKKICLDKKNDKLDSCTVLLHLSEWSDDFDPSSLAANGKRSVWAKVVSLVCTSPKYKNSPSHTFCIALGPKGADHTIVEQKFADELKTLADGGIDMRHTNLDKQVVVKAHLLYCLQDQPERRAATDMSAGNSNYTRRFGYCYHVKNNQDKLPSCASCLNKLLCRQTVENCDVCYNWKFLQNGETDEDATMMTFEGMKTDCSHATQKIVGKEWGPKEAHEYLKKSGFSKKAQDSVIQHATCVRSYRTTMEQTEKTQEGNDILSHQKNNKSLYEEYRGPPTWRRGIELTQHVDAPMHLLFHGIVKKIIRWISQYFVHKKLGAQFLKYVSFHNVNEIKDKNLEWCKSEEYSGGKLQGWVAEQYLAHARLLPWFYGWIDVLLKNTIHEGEYEEPTTETKNWKKNVCAEWLKVRGLTVKKEELAKELRRRIVILKNRKEGPPKVQPAKGGDIGEVLQMIQALHAMIALLMSRPPNKLQPDNVADEASRRIKIFLTLFARCDRRFHTGADKDLFTWVSCPNFTTLLNVPRMIKLYGSLRDLWEGDFKGEGSIREIKPVVAKVGNKANWAVSALTKIHQNRGMTDIMNQLERTTSGVTSHSAGFQHRFLSTKLFHIYSHMVEAQCAFANREPLSVIIVQRPDEENLCYMITSVDRTTLEAKGMQLVLKKNVDNTVEKLGLTYFGWSCLDCEQSFDIGGYSQRMSLRYCLLLPLPDCAQLGLLGRQSKPAQQHPHREDNSNNNNVVRLYAVIDSEWHQMDMTFQFAFPNTPSGKVSNEIEDPIEASNAIADPIEVSTNTPAPAGTSRPIIENVAFRQTTTNDVGDSLFCDSSDDSGMESDSDHD